MADPMKKYRVIGTQPVFMQGQSVPPGESGMMTDKDAAFPLQIGAIELDAGAPGAKPFNTMSTGAKKDE